MYTFWLLCTASAAVVLFSVLFAVVGFAVVVVFSVDLLVICGISFVSETAATAGIIAISGASVKF